MADKKPVPRYYSGTPGLKGAVKDLVKAVGESYGPGATIKRRAKEMQYAADDAALGRMREGQSTDSNNR
jgi:hypothetical protein